MKSEFVATERARYERLCGAVDQPESLTCRQLVLRFLVYAEDHYQKRVGTTEVDNFRDAGRALWFYEDVPAAKFRATQLRASREWMIEEGLARTTINTRVKKIKHIWKWAAERELVPADSWHSLQAVQPLKRGRSAAKETRGVLPVPDHDFWPVMRVLDPTLAAMCQVQWWSGMRPGEVVQMRGEDIQMGGRVTGLKTRAPISHAGEPRSVQWPQKPLSSASFLGSAETASPPIWIYTPPHHKTEHHGKSRSIYLGPHCQEILMGGSAHAVEHAISSIRSVVGAVGTTVLRPGYLFLSRLKKPYTVNGYGQQIKKGCVKAGVEPWGPNRLRHSAATRIEREADIETARILLGHSKATTTEIYIERDRDAAMLAALKLA